MTDKDLFIRALEMWLTSSHDNRPDRGEVTLMAGVLRCLRQAPDVSEYSQWLNYLDHFLVAAFDEIRIGDANSELREKYKEETGYDVPDLYEAHVGGLHRLMVVNSLTRLCGRLAGNDWVESRLAACFGAQAGVMDQAWSRFVAKAYWSFMARINAESHRSNVGQFGETTLTTYACAGRVMFTFSRGNDKAQYVADDGDPVGIRSGPNVSSSRYDVVVSMIEEVTRLWSMDEMRPVE